MTRGCQASSKSTLPTNRVPRGESIDVLFFDVGGYLYKKHLDWCSQFASEKAQRVNGTFVTTRLSQVNLFLDDDQEKR